MADQIAMSFAVPNYSGALFVKGNVEHPLTAAMAGKTAYTNSVEFVVGQHYTVGGGSQPAISEEASLTAPDSTVATRSQMTNVTQIFQEKVYVSYAKMSNMGTLSGANISGQQPNPKDELAFQTSVVLKKIANDIEYTALNGVYNKATADDEVNKTRGVLTAITTNTKAMANKPLDYWSIVDLMKTMSENNAIMNGLTLICDGTTLLQVTASCKALGVTVYSDVPTEAGIKINQIVTPYGNLGLRLQPYMPAKTAAIINEAALRFVEQPTPDKGNFFLEELAKTGAGESYQIFGQLGVDHGPEWLHGKFTNISNTFTAPEYGQIVAVSGTVNTKTTA